MSTDSKCVVIMKIKELIILSKYFYFILIRVKSPINNDQENVEFGDSQVKRKDEE